MATVCTPKSAEAKAEDSVEDPVVNIMLAFLKKTENTVELNGTPLTYASQCKKQRDRHTFWQGHLQKVNLNQNH